MLQQTAHLAKRANQRGIKTVMLNLVELLGVDVGDRRVLTKKQCQSLSHALGNIKRHLDKMAEKGGYVQVSDCGRALTAYRVDSYSRSRSKEQSHRLKAS